MSIDLLALISGAILSLLFSYIPGLAPKFQALLPETKRLIMAALLLLVSVVIFGLACGNVLESLWPGLGIACTQAGALSLVRIFVLALISSQSTYSLSPATTSVTQAKLDALRNRITTSGGGQPSGDTPGITGSAPQG